MLSDARSEPFVSLGSAGRGITRVLSRLKSRFLREADLFDPSVETLRFGLAVSTGGTLYKV